VTGVRPNDGTRDIEVAVAELAERLPDALHALAGIAFNYRWSWMPGGAEVFRDMDPSRWDRSQGNPRAMIETVPPHRMKQLANDRAYVARVAGLAECLEGELRRPSMATGLPPGRPVAYFCSEFGVHRSLPLYGGGLGVLAGDVLKAASDLSVPMVAVGLLYREGYFHQRLDLSGWQHEWWTLTEFERLPIVLVTGPDNHPLTVEVAMRGRTVRIQIWRLDVGRVPLYLLDTDRPDNDPIDRWITARLYIGDRHVRLTQYGVLGVGGVRALAALGIEPGVIHLNEGHPALASFERLRQLIVVGHVPEAALEHVRQATVFTTHRSPPATNGTPSTRSSPSSASCVKERTLTGTSSTGCAGSTVETSAPRSPPRRSRCKRAGRPSESRAAMRRWREPCGRDSGRGARCTRSPSDT
jgi:glycogen phosphorylase